MTTIASPRKTPWAGGRLKSRTTATAKTAAERTARFSELRQVGGLSKRCARRSRAMFLASARVEVWRPVRPRVSIVPAGVPR